MLGAQDDMGMGMQVGEIMGKMENCEAGSMDDGSVPGYVVT